MVSLYPTSETLEGIELRDKIFRARLGSSLAFCRFYHISLSDVDALSIEEFEVMFELYEKTVAELNSKRK